MGITKRTTFSGISLAYAKKIVNYEFSDAVIKIERNEANHTYELHLIDKIDKKAIEKFISYWKNNFRVKVYSIKYELP